MSEPKPWRRDDSAPASVRELLERAASARAPAKDREAMERGLAALLASEAPSSTPTPRPTALLLTVATACCVVVGSLLWWAWPERAAPAAHVVTPSVSLEVRASPEPPPPSVPEQAPAPTPVVRRRRSRELHVAEPETPEPAPEVIVVADTVSAPELEARPSEIALLREARSALSAPHRALEVLERHAILYPQGVFAEEREALWVQALVRAGRNAEARSRAERLFLEHPATAHRAHLLELLEAGSEN